MRSAKDYSCVSACLNLCSFVIGHGALTMWTVFGILIWLAVGVANFRWTLVKHRQKTRLYMYALSSALSVALHYKVTDDDMYAPTSHVGACVYMHVASLLLLLHSKHWTVVRALIESSKLPWMNVLAVRISNMHAWAHTCTQVCYHYTCTCKWMLYFSILFAKIQHPIYKLGTSCA